MSDIFSKLSAPFRPSEVDWRVGSTTKDKSKGMALAYLDARAVMMRLDDVCGPAGWQNRYTVGEGKTICEIGIKCGDEWIWKADGAGNSDIEAEKGALSDAFKRAAVRWGVGRYLYDMGSPWVALEAKGNSYVIAESERNKLNALLSKGVAHEPALPPPAAKKMTPADWAADAIKAIEAFDTKLGLDAWLQRNEPKLTRLQTTDAVASNALWQVVDKQASRLNTLAAG